MRQEKCHEGHEKSEGHAGVLHLLRFFVAIGWNSVYLSKMSVTGPSFNRETFMKAPNTPVST